MFLNHINIFTLLNCIDGKNLVIISDKSYYPNYYLFFFHQGELGVHIPCKPTHPNVTVSLIHWERLNEMEQNTEVIAYTKVGFRLIKSMTLLIGFVKEFLFQLVFRARTRTDVKTCHDK